MYAKARPSDGWGGPGYTFGNRLGHTPEGDFHAFELAIPLDCRLTSDLSVCRSATGTQAGDKLFQDN